MAVEALGKNHLLPRKELGPEIIISPRARQGRGRTIHTRGYPTSVLFMRVLRCLELFYHVNIYLSRMP